MATGQSVWITLVTGTAALALVVRGQVSSSSSQTPSTAKSPAISTTPPATENYTLENTTDEEGTGEFISPLSSDAFVFTPTLILVIGVGGFVVLVALPLLIIMILIIALGYVCKKYKRLKKRFTLLPPPQVIASSTYSGEPTTSEKENSIILKTIEMLDVGDNGIVCTVMESQIVAAEADSGTMQQTHQTSDEKGNDTNNDTLTVDTPTVDDIDIGDNVAYGQLSSLSNSRDVAGEDATNMEEEREEEFDREPEDTGSYEINDLYTSISF